MEKHEQCCAQLIGRITHYRGVLSKTANQAARADQKCADMKPWKLRITKAQQELEAAKLALVDHEADHAEGRL